MDKATLVLVIILFLSWGLQSVLSILQTKKILARIRELRSLGRIGIGAAGNIYKGKVYGFVVVNEGKKIIKAEILSGWTVFAKLKPYPILEGLDLRDLLDYSAENKKNIKKELDAFKVAANYLLEKENETLVNLKEQEVKH